MSPRCARKFPGCPRICAHLNYPNALVFIFNSTSSLQHPRTLKPKGVFIVVSYGIPDNRLSYLEVKDYGWTVTVKTVPKPTVSAASVPDTKDSSSVHYIYIMQKSGSDAAS